MLEIAKIVKPITESDLEIIAENLSCSPAEFQEQLAQKVVKEQISQIQNIKLINTEKTLGEKSNFSYIIYHEKEFYFIRVDSDKIPHKKQIIQEQKKLEETLGIIPTGTFCFNPFELGEKRAKRILRKKYQIIDLNYDENSLEKLAEEQNSIPDFKSDLQYVSGNKNFQKGGYWEQRKEKEEINLLHYCLGENLSEKQKRKGCQEGFKENFSKNCKGCKSYRLFAEESTKLKTKNQDNKNAIEYLRLREKFQTDEEVKPTGTELSNAALEVLYKK